MQSTGLPASLQRLSLSSSLHVHSDSTGNGLDLKTQCYIMYNTPAHRDPRSTPVLYQIEQHVESRQLDKPLGVGSGAYPDIECDEVTVAQRLRPDGKLEWVQYWGVMRRRAPHSLKLIKLPSR
eukprot:5586615-Amphidinium_carterae.1